MRVQDFLSILQWRSGKMPIKGGAPLDVGRIQTNNLLYVPTLHQTLLLLPMLHGRLHLACGVVRVACCNCMTQYCMLDNAACPCRMLYVICVRHTLHVACCMLHDACCTLYVACCTLHLARCICTLHVACCKRFVAWHVHIACCMACARCAEHVCS
jgi:hypothetical protein